VNYFIDTNIIIDLINTGNSTTVKEARQKATELLKPILEASESKIYINRLVMIESLRTIKYIETGIFRRAEETLENFERLDITQEIYDEAIAFSRFCQSIGATTSNKGNCQVLDFLHFITAKHYNLEILTYDTKDFNTMMKAYPKFKETNQ